MKNKMPLLLCFLLLGLPMAYTQDAGTFSDQVLGEWHGKGTLFGQEAQFSMQWENTLNDRFLRLTFSNQFKDASGTDRMMQAEAYYNLQKANGHWFDTRGQTLPLTLEINENSMTVYWGTEDTERGKTVYTLANKEATVEDFVMKQGAYASFGKAHYNKTAE